MAQSPRSQLAAQVCNLIGGDVTVDVNPGNGWPARLGVKVDGNTVPVTLHVALTTTHSRKPHERRYQNPRQNMPILEMAGTLPLMVGFDGGPSPIIVVADGRLRVGRMTRFGVLFDMRILDEARQTGWSEYISNTGERIFAMHPRLLPIVVEMLVTNALPPAFELVLAAQAAGVVDNLNDEAVLQAAANRACRAALVLVRRTGFGNLVRKAYNEKCAMCGLGINLVQGAHIKPVSAPNSPDLVWNGMALCHNHHGLFDSHRLWVDPDTYQIVKHPALIQEAAVDPIVQQFTSQIRNAIIPPVAAASRPRPQMFKERYGHFEGLYAWR